MLNLTNFENNLIEAYAEYFDSENSSDFFSLIPYEASKDRVELERRVIICGIHIAIEGKSKERELFSRLLVNGCLELRCLSRVRVESAFNFFLENTKEIFMDNPKEGSYVFSAILAKAIADEVLQPEFITHNVFYNADASAATTVATASMLSPTYLLSQAYGLLQTYHGMVKLDYVWENYAPYCGNKSPEMIEAKLQMSVREFIDSHDFFEIKREISEMGAAALNSEWVYQIVLAFFEEKSFMDRKPAHEQNCSWLMCLLQTLLSEGYLTMADLCTALKKIKAGSLYLDYPNFISSFDQLSKTIRIN